jgi:predicted esterase YcpF (UPF0227 family)
MKTVIYIHGFLSSPASTKARQTEAWLREQRPDVSFQCPALSSYPKLARQTLLDCVQSCDHKPYLVGSSLGGFWSSFLIELGLAEKAVLVNPAVSPHTRFRQLVGETLKSYYSDDTFTLTGKDLDTLQECEKELNDPGRYWLLLQTGDEVLDYRMAQERYRGAKQLVEEGGDHSFQGFERWLPDIMDFFES